MSKYHIGLFIALASRVATLVLTTSTRQPRAADVYTAQPLHANPSDRTIDPHTGLPMNVGAHTGSAATPMVGENVRPGHATDWDAVKKGNTLY